MRIKLLYAFLCLLLIIFTLNRNSYDGTRSVYNPIPQITLPEGINHLFDNSVSELEEMAAFDRTVERFLKRWEIMGASIAIMKDGKLLYCKGFGWADKEQNVPTEVKHIFRIASISKLITATGIMKLYESGKLSLDDKVFGETGILCDSMFSNIKDARIKQITVEHLLRHQGGIRSGPAIRFSMR